MRKHLIWILAAGLLLAFSCKKNETTTSTPSLTGLSLEKNIPYVAEGTLLSFSANVKSVKASDSSNPGVMGMIWQVNSAKKDTLSKDIKLENPAFKYSADTLGSYTVTCYVYAAGGGYYNASTTASFQCISPITAMTGTAPVLSATVGGKEWMAFNCFNTESGTHYQNSEVVSPIFGRFYTWEEALTACPDGWHLPSAQEWDAIDSDAGDLMAPAKFLEKTMWTVAIGQAITNSTCFNAIPVGYQDKTASMEEFRSFGEYALYWTSTSVDQDLAQLRYIRYDQDKIQKGNGDKKTLALSVRCVMD